MCIAVILGLANNVFAGFLHGGGAAILQPAAPTGVAVGTAYPANLAYRPARAAQLVQQAARPVTVARPAVSVATAPAATVTYQQPAQVAFRGLLGGAAPAATFLSHAPAVTQVRRAFVQQAPVRVNVVQPVSYAAQAPFPAVGQTLIGPAPGGGVHVKHIVPATTAQQPFRQYVAAAPAPAAVVQQAPVHVKHIVSAPAPTFVQQAPVVRQVAVAAPTTTFVQQTPVLRQVAVPAPAVVHQPPVHVKQVFSAPAPAAFVQSVPLARQFAVQAPTRALLQQAPVHIKHIVQAPAPAVVQHAAPVFSAPRVTVAAAQHPAFGFRQVTVPGPAVSYRTAAAAAPVATFGAGLGFGHTIAAAPAQVHVKQLVSAPVAPAATTFVQQAPAVSVRHLAVAAPAAPAFAPRVTVAAPAPTLVQPALPAFAAPRVTVTAQAPVHYKQFVSAPAPTATVVQHAAPALSYRTAAVAAPVATFGAGLGFGHTLAAPAVVHHAAPALSVAAPTPPAFRPLALPAPTVLQHAAPAVAYRSAAVAAPLATFGAGLGFGHTLAAPALAAPAPVHVRQFLSAQHQTVVHHAASAFATPRYSATAVVQQAPLVRQIVAAPARAVVHHAPAAPVFSVPQVTVAAPAPAVVHHAAPAVSYRTAALAAPLATFGAGLGFGHTLAAPAFAASPASLHVKQFLSAPAPAATVVRQAPVFSAPQLTVAAAPAVVHQATPAVVQSAAPAVAYRTAALSAPLATFGAGLGFGNRADSAAAVVHHASTVTAPVPQVEHIVSAPAPSVYAAPAVAQAPAISVAHAPAPAVVQAAPVVHHVKQFVSAPAVAATARAFAAAPTLVHAAPAANLVAYRTAALGAPLATYGAGIGLGHTLAAPAVPHIKHIISAPAAAPAAVVHQAPVVQQSHAEAPATFVQQTPFVQAAPSVVAYRQAALTAPLNMFGAGLGFGHTFAAPSTGAALFHHATPAVHHVKNIIAAAPAFAPAAPAVAVAHAPAPAVVQHVAAAAPQVVAYKTAAVSAPVATFGTGLSFGHTLGAPAFLQAPASVPHVKTIVQHAPAAAVQQAAPVTVVQEQPTLVHDAAPATVAVHHAAPAAAVVHHATPAAAVVHHATPAAAVVDPLSLDLSYKKLFAAGLGMGQTISYGNGLDEEPGWETKYIELLRKRKK
ncbi:hypothetical protein HPB51_009922 [Rhipicephalus microplus]|uniref:Uncharacterized protein n=1 Tax=Rhipicephalus microplus TaxID=6941 RepID=A0A9J6ET14_RHIMP|nr:hypothetical protein HPB51_009922 [Rhipicephalus microplus]